MPCCTGSRDAEVAPVKGVGPSLTTSTLRDRGPQFVVGTIDEADYRPRRVVLRLLSEATERPGPQELGLVYLLTVGRPPAPGALGVLFGLLWTPNVLCASTG